VAIVIKCGSAMNRGLWLVARRFGKCGLRLRLLSRDKMRLRGQGLF